MRGVPRIRNAMSSPCPNCGCEQVYVVEVDIEDYPLLSSKRGTGTYVCSMSMGKSDVGTGDGVKLSADGIEYYLRNVVGARGRIFSVVFVKRTDGTKRKMVARFGVKRGLTGRGSPFNPADYDLCIVFDVQRHGYRMIPLDAVEEIHGARKVIRVQH